MSREMVNSGIPWIGDIPKGWSIAQLKRFCKVNSGREIEIEVERSSVDAIPVFGSGGVFKYTNKPQHEGEAVMFGRKGTLGKPMYVNGAFWAVDTMYFLTFTNTLRAKYCFYLLSAFNWDPYITQTALPSVVATDIVNAVFVFPSLSEQQKIASFLDRKCSEIDEMIALQEKIVEELKAYKQSVITEAVTKGLDPNVPMKDSGIEWIGEIPEHWEMYRIKYNTFLKGRIGWQGLNSSDFIDEGYCLITGTDFDNKGGINWDTCYRISKERFDEDELLHIKNGDLLMTKDGTVGKMAYIKNLPEEASLNSHLLIIRQTTEQIDNGFLYWVMLSNVFKRFCLIYQSGSIMSSISQSTLGLFSCYCPTKNEQERIVLYLNTKCTEIDNLISFKLSKIESLKEYKKSIIYEYVTGKKEVTL